MAFYSMIGFSVIATGLCYYVGFRDRNEMARVCATSVVLIIVFSVSTYTRTHMLIYKAQLDESDKNILSVFSAPIHFYPIVTYFIPYVCNVIYILLGFNEWVAITYGIKMDFKTQYFVVLAVFVLKIGKVDLKLLIP